MDIIRNSRKIPGAKGNYYWPVRFDWHADGRIGISQGHDKPWSGHTERVLLSPKEARELVIFINAKGISIRGSG